MRFILHVRHERGAFQFCDGDPSKVLIPEMVDKLPGFQAIEPVIQVFSHDRGRWGLLPFALVVWNQTHLSDIVVGVGVTSGQLSWLRDRDTVQPFKETLQLRKTTGMFEREFRDGRIQGMNSPDRLACANRDAI